MDWFCGLIDLFSKNGFLSCAAALPCVVLSEHFAYWVKYFGPVLKGDPRGVLKGTFRIVS